MATSAPASASEMLAAAACLALSHKADRADQSPALVPLNERVSSVDGIDRLHAWLSAKKKLNEEGVRLQGGHSKPAAKPQRNRTVASSHTASGRSKAKRNTSLVAAQPRRSLEEARKAIADAQRGTHEARRRAVEKAQDATEESPFVPAYVHPWKAARDEAMRTIRLKASKRTKELVTKELEKEVALYQEHTHNSDGSLSLPLHGVVPEGTEDTGELEIGDPSFDTELQVLRAAELVSGRGR